MRFGAVLLISSAIVACATGPKVQAAPTTVPTDLSAYTKGEMRGIDGLLGPTACPAFLTSPDGAIRLMRFRVDRGTTRTVTVNGRQQTSGSPTPEVADYRVLQAAAWQIPAGRFLRIDCRTLAVQGTVKE